MMYSGDEFYGDEITSPFEMQRQVYYGNSTTSFDAEEPAPTAILICPSCHGEIEYYSEIDDGAEEITLGDREHVVCDCDAVYGEDDVLEVQPEPAGSAIEEA